MHKSRLLINFCLNFCSTKIFIKFEAKNMRVQENPSILYALGSVMCLLMRSGSLASVASFFGSNSKIVLFCGERRKLSFVLENESWRATGNRRGIGFGRIDHLPETTSEPFWKTPISGAPKSTASPRSIGQKISHINRNFPNLRLSLSLRRFDRPSTSRTGIK